MDGGLREDPACCPEGGCEVGLGVRGLVAQVVNAREDEHVFYCVHRRVRHTTLGRVL